MSGLGNVEFVLEEMAKVFDQASQLCFERANKETNPKIKRDELVAGNVWRKAAAHLRETKTGISKEWANEKIREEILKYHKDDE